MADGDRTRRIVVGVDGSMPGERALRWALHDAAERGGEVLALMVRNKEELLPGASFAMLPYGRRPVGDEAEYQRRLHGAVLAAQVDLSEVPPVAERVVAGDPGGELVKASADADLLVVGSHGHGPLADVLLGSVAGECVRHAFCPVVVLTPATEARRR